MSSRLSKNTATNSAVSIQGALNYTKPVHATVSRLNLRQLVTRNGNFRVLGSSATFSTQQFSNYLRLAGVPLSIHMNSAYSVAIMTILLRSEGFFCVVPPQKFAPTLHSWVDIVAYFEYARSLAKMGQEAIDQKRKGVLIEEGKEEKSTTNNNTNNNNNNKSIFFSNWMDVIPPDSAIHSPSLEPDPQLQPRRRVACMAIALYSSWWMQHTSGYFRWIYPLAISEVEEKKKAVDKVRRQGNGTNEADEGGSASGGAANSPIAKKVAGVPDSVKAHARFFLFLDWGGYFVGKVVQQAMSRSLSEYGLKKEIHAFISQHLSDLCTTLDAHFRIYRYLLATEKPMLCDVMLASAFEFLLKDDPPRSDITDGSFRHLERFVAEVTGNETKLRELQELAEEEENTTFSSKRRKLKERQQRVQLFGFRNRDRLVQQERQLLQEEYAATAEAEDEKKGGEGNDSSDHHNTTSATPRRRPAPEELPETKSSKKRGLQTVPFRQQTTDEDIVPETLAPFFSLMEEVFPWLQAQRNSVEDRINAFLDTGSPLDVLELPNVPCLKEFAGKRVPCVGKLPRLVSNAWEMEIENPPGAEFSHFDRASAETFAARTGQTTSTIISCGTSMPHLLMTQFVAKDLSEENCARFVSTPEPPASTRAVGGVIPISDEKLEYLRQQLVDLKLEDPWDVAPQFEDRADNEYVVFRRQVVQDQDEVEVIDETREGQKKKKEQEKKKTRRFFKRFGNSG